MCHVDTTILEKSLDAGTIPVVSPLAMDKEGNVLNCNADTMAAEIAIALKSAKLILMSNVPGVLEDAQDSSSLLHFGDLGTLDTLQESGSFSRGMRPKIEAVRRAIKGGVPRAHVIDSGRKGSLLEEIFTNDGCGTLIVHQIEQVKSETLSTAHI